MCGPLLASFWCDDKVLSLWMPHNLGKPGIVYKKLESPEVILRRFTLPSSKQSSEARGRGSSSVRFR